MFTLVGSTITGNWTLNSHIPDSLCQVFGIFTTNMKVFPNLLQANSFKIQYAWFSMGALYKYLHYCCGFKSQPDHHVIHLDKVCYIICYTLLKCEWEAVGEWLKSAWHDPQHHSPNFFETHCDFGTKSLVIFFWLLWWNLVWIFQIL